MPVLQYDISVVGLQNVERALASIEKRFTEHNRRMVREVGRVQAMPALRASARRASGPAAIRQEEQGLARSFQQLSRVGMTADRQRYREQMRLERDASRERLRNIASESRAAARAQREFRSRTGRVVGAVGQSLAGIGSTALAVTGLGGGALIASRLGGAASLERRQRQVIVNARGAGEANPIEYADLQKRIAATATASGASQEDVTAGIEKFVQRTGQLNGPGGALGYMDSLATASVATGASMEDLAGVAADLQQKFDIKAPKDMADALSVLAMQGKKGAFELRDMATTFPELAAAAASVGMKGTRGMRTLGGLAQISRSATGSGEEASTALQMVLTQIGGKGAGLQAGKFTSGRRVNVFSDKGMTQFRDPREVIADVIAGTRGNIPELEKIFEKRGKRAINPLITTFNEANMAALKSGATPAAAADKGREAILKAIDDAANASGTFADMQRDAADVQKSANVQLERLNTALTSAVQRDLLPALVRLIPQFQQMIPLLEDGVEKLAKFVGFLATNPYEGIGLLISGKVTADLAQAGIGAAVKGILVSLVSGIAAQGGIAAAGANAVGAAGTAIAGKLGLGAVGAAGLTAGLAGAGAAIGVGAAGYNLYKLHEETQSSGGIIAGIQEAIHGPARASTPEEYDEMLRKMRQGAPSNQPRPASAADRETARLQHQAAKMQLEAARLNAAKANQPNRGNAPSPVKG